MRALALAAAGVLAAFGGTSYADVKEIDVDVVGSPDGTRLHALVHASGEMEDGWPEAVDRIWDHFIGVRLRAWLAGELPAE